MAVPEDGHFFAAGCACGLPYSQHDRYQQAMQAAIVAERAEREGNVMRRVVDRALASAIPVRSCYVENRAP